jgi:hypothetical protein
MSYDMNGVNSKLGKSTTSIKTPISTKTGIYKLVSIISKRATWFEMRALPNAHIYVNDQIWHYSIISDISDKVRYFHWIPEPCHWFQARYIWPRVDISDVLNISSFQSGFRAIALAPGQIYAIQDGYIWCVRHIRPPVDSQNLGGRVQLDISYLHLIYPTRPKSAELDSEFKG